MSLERRRLQLYLALLISDAAILLGSFALAAALYAPHRPGHLAMLSGYLLLPLFQTIAMYNGSYSREGLTNWRLSAMRCLMALLVSSLLLSFLTFLLKSSAELSRVIFAVGVIGSAALMIALRFAVAKINMAMWGPSMTNRLLIDAGGSEVRIPHLYRVSAREHGLAPDLKDPVMLDRLSRYLRNMDQVIVSCQPQDRLAWAEVLKGSGIHGEVISDFAREIGALGIVMHREANLYSLLVSSGQLALRARVTKRVFDVAVASVGLLALSPVLLACALAIKLEDDGAVFFRQRRMGRGNTFFDIYKFRSMREARADHTGNQSASRDDDRTTRIGRFMRRTSLDELPQLINVVKGEMSTVDQRLPAPQPCDAGDCRGPHRASPASPYAACGRRSAMIQRVFLWGLLAVLAAIVAIVQIDRQAYHDPAAIALSPPATSVVARQRMIELATVSGHADAATLAASRRLVRWRPVPAHNLVLYAQSAQLAGEQDQLLPALELAASRGWREPLLQVMAGRAALLSGDADGAANRIAALIATGAAPAERRLLSAELMQQAPGRAALARLFERPGHYSPRLLSALAEVGSPRQVLDIVRQARRAGGALDCVALRDLAARWQRQSPEPGADRLLATGCNEQP